MNQSLSERDPCSVQYGCVGSSGYGDGCYSCLAKIDANTDKVIAIRIVFVDDLENDMLETVTFTDRIC